MRFADGDSSGTLNELRSPIQKSRAIAIDRMQPNMTTCIVS
jgi:hypothetical protein